MRNRIELFKENTALGGFSIAVRDDWSFKIKRLHISTEEKEAYEKKFKGEILLEREFLEWWMEYKKENDNGSKNEPAS